MCELSASMPVLAHAPLLLASALDAAYWICLIVGGGLLLFSVLAGAGGHGDVSVDGGHVEFGGDMAHGPDVDAAHGMDVDAHHGLGDGHGGDVHAPGPSLATWFSIRFVIFFMAVFGALGVIFTHLTSTPRGTTLAIALVGGLAVGQLVHQILRSIRRSAGDSATQPRDYVNKLARVTVRITPSCQGEVALQVRTGERFVPATAVGATKEFKIGDEVVVIAYRGGVAEVVAKHEFQPTGSPQGD